MTRDFLMATIAALGLTACGPDLKTEPSPPANVGTAPAAPAANDPAVAQAGKSDETPPAAGDPKEGEKKEDAEKAPR